MGELLRRKALAAVLKASAAKYKQKKQQRQQRKGTAEPSDVDDGSLTHHAIRKYGKSCQKTPRTGAFCLLYLV